MDEDLVVAIDWYLGKKAFKELVNNLIYDARKNGKVIALPLILEPGFIAGLELVTSIISQVNCNGCNAPCCKYNPNDKQTVALIMPEYERLKKIIGDKELMNKGVLVCHNGTELSANIPLPCPFLNKSNKYSIYDNRPLVCVLFPFQPGASDDKGNSLVALSADCPEARRIAKRIYLTYWSIRRQYKMLNDAGVLNQGINKIFGD